MRAFVEELARRVGAAWARVDHDPAAFPAIAAEALAHDEPPSLFDLLGWLTEDGPIAPQQLASGFGEPPITLHVGDRWAIQLLVWVNGRTTVHEHDFSGAFRVVMGSSIQRTYRWEGPRTGAPLALGELVLERTRLLSTGAIELIRPGAALIHSVFHLDRPTLSLVVRTDGGALDGPQYDYWGPHVALDPEHAEPRAVRQVQTLTTLLRSALAWEDFAAALLERADLHQTFRVLDLVIGMHGGADPPARLLALAGHRHSERAIARVLASIRHARWEHGVIERRDLLRDDEHRFFFAALLCAPTRAAVLELVGARFSDPRTCVRRWLAEIVARGEDGTADPHIAALCTFAIEASMEGTAPADVARRLSERNAEPTIGDPNTFVAQLRTGALAALFRD